MLFRMEISFSSSSMFPVVARNEIYLSCLLPIRAISSQDLEAFYNSERGTKLSSLFLTVVFFFAFTKTQTYQLLFLSAVSLRQSFKPAVCRTISTLFWNLK